MKNNKIDEVFKTLKSKGKTAFIPFISIGDPDMETSLEIAKALIKNGADIIELGFPFSDQMADGKVIQRSYERALKRKISMEDAFDFIKRLKAFKDIPVIFFTYYNPVFILGKKFAEGAHSAGIDGILIVDLPPEESRELTKYIQSKNIYQIYLLAPTTGNERMKQILSLANGFVYYVSVTGVTGARKSLPETIKSKIKEIREISSIPIGVGFGISSKDQAKDIGGCADAIIIGSKIIQFIEDNINDKQAIIQSIAEFSSDIKSSL